MRPRGIDHNEAAPSLTLQHVSVAYGAPPDGGSALLGQQLRARQIALDDISFQVRSGEQVAVVGPNGAGKSTLFKVIAGTLKPDAGQVHVFGHDPGQHICIAYVPQRNQIDWSFPVTAEDVVMMGRIGQIGLLRWPLRRDWEIVQNCLERVNSAHLAKRQIGELSAGQQQRVFIARALAQGSDILLLDEPFSGLDVPSHDAILEILQSLPGEVTTLVATHDLNLAAERFDLVMLLNRRIVHFGSPGAVLTPENLVSAYGGQMHVVSGESENLILADTCCDESDLH